MKMQTRQLENWYEVPVESLRRATSLIQKYYTSCDDAIDLQG